MIDKPKSESRVTSCRLHPVHAISGYPEEVSRYVHRYGTLTVVLLTESGRGNVKSSVCSYNIQNLLVEKVRITAGNTDGWKHLSFVW